MDQDVLLFDETYRWLETLPEDEEVDQYVRALSSDQLLVMVNIQLQCTERLFWEKDAYYADHNLEKISQILSPAKEVVFLSYVAGYNPTSVIEKYTETYPEMRDIVVPEGFSEWANFFCQVWSSLSIFRAYPEYIQQAVLLHSFQDVHFQVPQMVELAKELQREVNTDIERTERGIDLSQQEQSNFKALMGRMSFLPPSYIEELTMPFFLEKKRLLFTRVINVLALLQKNSDLNRADIDKLLLEDLRIAEEESMIREFQQLALDQNPDSTSIDYLNQVMPRLWIEASILSGDTIKMLSGYIQGLQGEQRHKFVLQLYASMRQATQLIDMLDPLSPPYVIKRLQLIADESNFSLFLGDMLELVNEEDRPLVTAVIKLFYRIIQSYPEGE